MTFDPRDVILGVERVTKDELLKWLDTHPDPDEAIFCIPDEFTGSVTPRQLAQAMRDGTWLGKMFETGLKRTVEELGLGHWDDSEDNK